ncbi:threonine aldolase family protein [Paenirhodobacter populi]|uniref:Aminotransferase class I/II-fold pyridoxal phosphate-dependent enzyme n=1 Tax=Paenirhodobacter populi TaxID=2306993 RepID=A0A443JIN0_9RHOB|nr:GntG family PLP-dependent aldolase [Sinirhodobacter populi]RWR20425.1 aminotransferase class I/II-fold pyridoxal phosphate-dependent enzyme [Sinirhodobacter populi]
MTVEIDLISDTSTRPGAEMLAAMCAAETGDEQRYEDPTTLALEIRAAELLGQEKALFLPSGTMCNQISFLVHCRPGDEIICADSAHVFGSEGAGAAALAGAQFRPISSSTGIFTADDALPLIREPRHRSPRSRVIEVEQTTNRGGGRVWPVAALQDLATLAHERDMALHMDGARLFNASVSAGLPARAFASLCDSVWVDLSKGLGCPFGAVLAGSEDFIAEALIWKHRLGGAMRQSGFMAAAGLFAFDHNIERLADDHRNAEHFATVLRDVSGLKVTPESGFTNIVFLDLSELDVTAPTFAAALLESGVRVNVEGPKRIRVVTHLDVSTAQVARAADLARETLLRLIR